MHRDIALHIAETAETPPHDDVAKSELIASCTPADGQDFWTWIYAQFAAALEAPTMALDLRLRDAWRYARDMGYDLPDDLKPHQEAAKDRLRFIRHLNECAKFPTITGELQIADSETFLPSSYHERLVERRGLAQRRLVALQSFDHASFEPISDLALSAAWEELCRLGCGHFIAPNRQERVLLAQRRVEQLAALDQCPGDSVELREQHLLQLWDEELLAGCRDADRWRPVVEAIRLKAARFAELLQERAVLDALLENDLGRFRELFDRRIVGRLGVHAPHHQRIIGAWVEREILSADRCGLACRPPQGLQRRDAQAILASWTWPPPTIAGSCLCIITRDRVGQRTQPDDVTALFSFRVDRESPDDAPSIVLSNLHDCGDAQVYVWAVVDLGFQTFYSEPILLGSLQTAYAPKPPSFGRRIS